MSHQWVSNSCVIKLQESHAFPSKSLRTTENQQPLPIENPAHTWNVGVSKKVAPRLLRKTPRHRGRYSFIRHDGPPPNPSPKAKAKLSAELKAKATAKALAEEAAKVRRRIGVVGEGG